MFQSMARLLIQLLDILSKVRLYIDQLWMAVSLILVDGLMETVRKAHKLQK